MTRLSPDAYTLHRDQQGLATLEFILVLPVLLLVMFGGFEVTRYILSQQRLDKAAFLLGNIATQYKPAKGTGAPDELTMATVQNEIFPQFIKALSDSNVSSGDAVAILTGVRKEGSEYRIKWQVSGGGTLSDATTVSEVNGVNANAITPSVQANQVATFTPEVLSALASARDQETFVVVEGFFHYRPIFTRLLSGLSFPVNIGEKTIARRIFITSRTGPQICLPGGTNNYVYAECNAGGAPAPGGPSVTPTPVPPGYFVATPGASCGDYVVYDPGPPAACIPLVSLPAPPPGTTLGTGTPPGSVPSPAPGGGGCFVGDVLVSMADGTKKPIADIQFGEKLVGATRVNHFVHPETHLSNEVLYGFNGERPFVTGEHQLMTTKGWRVIDPKLALNESHGTIRREALKVGDRLVLEDGSTMRIRSIDAYDSGETVRLYNPGLDGDHTYYVNGILVHNLYADSVQLK